uniref:Non-specific protein-tyrosine kinase n=1 Tax=Romanomermis culicivorax TaxID=13658 RepID=A0A915LB55_ROMCU
MKTPRRTRTPMGKTKLAHNKSSGGKSGREDDIKKSQNLSTFGAIFGRLKNVVVKLGLSSLSKRMLSTTDYYHYYVPREEVDQMLKNEGEFLLRAIVTRDARISVILSICGEHKKIDHIVVEYKPSTKLFHFIKEIGRECIPDLVEHHIEKRIPVFGHILKKPVVKCWEEVLGDRIELNTNKILGEGNFAVVYKGKFRITHDKWIRMACKKIKIDKCKNQFDKLEAKRQIIREYDISRTCIHHPNVLSIYGILIETEEVALLMEFCDGILSQ